MQAFLMVVHVLLAITLIGLILIQHGKGADAGAAFGSGASGTVFGARGSGSFLTKITTFLAIGFFANSLALAYLSANMPEAASVVDSFAQQAVENDPAVAAGDAPSTESAAQPAAANAGDQVAVSAEEVTQPAGNEQPAAN